MHWQDVIQRNKITWTTKRNPDRPLHRPLCMHAHTNKYKINWYEALLFSSSPAKYDSGATIVTLLWLGPFAKCLQATIQRYKPPIHTYPRTAGLDRPRRCGTGNLSNIQIFEILDYNYNIYIPIHKRFSCLFNDLSQGKKYTWVIGGTYVYIYHYMTVYPSLPTDWSWDPTGAERVVG